MPTVLVVTAVEAGFGIISVFDVWLALSPIYMRVTRVTRKYGW